MSRIVLIRAWPLDPATRAPVPVHLAGGGSRTSYRIGGVQYRAGVVREPRFSARLGYDAGGWTGGTAPAAAPIQYRPAEPALADALGQLYWRDAAIEIDAGEEGGPLIRRLTGTVADTTVQDGALVITAADASVRLDKPVAPDFFTGAGDLEGIVATTGRRKRRSLSRALNVEGRVLDQANNIYEFGDPARPIAGCLALRDKGREGPLVLLAWAGSPAATLAALRAASAPEGGGIFAPSIACGKWWTVPAGPLTADLLGETGVAEGGTVAHIAAALLAGTGEVLADQAAVAELRPAIASYHVDEDESVAQALDRLMLGSSLIWIAQPAGGIAVRPWSFDAPVEALAGIYAGREASLPPVSARRLGYKRNERVHQDAEISIAVPGATIDRTNLVRMSRFEQGTRGWAQLYATGGAALTDLRTGEEAGSRYIEAEWAVSGAAETTSFGQAGAYRISVIGISRLAVQLGVKGTGPLAAIRPVIWWANAAGVTFDFSSIATLPGNPPYNTSVRAFVDVPAGAVSAYIEVYGDTSGAGTVAVALTLPMVTVAHPEQTEYPAFVPGLVDGEAGASGTNGADGFVLSASLTGEVIPANSAGVPVSGLPSTIDFKAWLGAADVTGATTWSGADVDACNVDHLGGGQYRINSVTPGARRASFAVTAGYGAYSQTLRLPVALAPAGSDAQFNRATSLGSPTSSWAPAAAVLSLQVFPGTTISITAWCDYQMYVAGTGAVYMRIEYRNLTDGGAWTQIGGDVAGSNAWRTSGPEPDSQPGSCAIGGTAPAPVSSSKVYEFRTLWVRTNTVVLGNSGLQVSIS